MPKRTASPCLNTVRLVDPELAGLKQEEVAARTPFTHVHPILPHAPSTRAPHSRSSSPPGAATIDPSGPNFLGWTRLCIGLKSSSAQRRTGLWLHREDWIWGEAQIDLALVSLAAEAEPGQVVAVAVVSAPVQRYEKSAELAAVKLWPFVHRLGPPEHPALYAMQWLVPAEALEVGGNQVVLEKSGSYLLVKKYTRSPLTGSADRRGWSTVRV